jgi:hypothetical protein
MTKKQIQDTFFKYHTTVMNSFYEKESKYKNNFKAFINEFYKLINKK